MEIKKYVLLKNNNVIKFYDNDKFGLLKNNTVAEFYENNKLGFLYIEEEGGTIYIKNALTIDIKLTSDNLLDLVEVEDMVMSDDYVGALKVLSNTKHYFRTYHAIVAKKNVKAIYKRQSNGDYKRYEVEV